MSGFPVLHLVSVNLSGIVWLLALTNKRKLRLFLLVKATGLVETLKQ